MGSIILDGDYIEYFPTNYYYFGDKIKIKGQFGFVIIDQISIDPTTGEKIRIKNLSNERVGTWTKYDIDGNKLLEVVYDWVK